MYTFCCTTLIVWKEDMVACQDALVGCFVTTPFLFPFQPQLSHLLSQTILLFSHPLHYGCLKVILGMNLMASTSVLFSFFSFQCLIVWRLQFCEVSMKWFSLFLNVCVLPLNVLCMHHDVLCYICEEWILFDAWSIVMMSDHQFRRTTLIRCNERYFWTWERYDEMNLVLCWLGCVRCGCTHVLCMIRMSVEW